jgi:VWFA-related protein
VRYPAVGVCSQLIVAALLAAGAAAVAPQQSTEKTPQEPQRPTFRSEANFVRVDVYPTSGGKPLLDLRKEDFDVLEDGRPQAIETFEHVRISAGGARSERADPSSLEAMRQAAADPRSRIFVIFLDAPHVTSDGARNIGQALIRFLDRALGPDDLVGIMAPWMSPSDVVLARKTQVIENALRDASWGRRFTTDEDQRESMYKACYRVLQQEREQGKTVSDLAKVLTVRRREVLTLEALRDLVVYLRDVREERKAIVAVTEGWALFRPDDQITRLREECTCPRGMARRDLQDCSGCEPWPKNSPWKEQVPGAEPIRVGPDGRLRMGSVETLTGSVSVNDCNADRMRFANIDNARFARDLANDANRANATFYTIDPRGLAVFDMPIYRDMDEVGLAPNVIEDQRSMRSRHDAMANLASATDGIAVMNSNDLDAGLRRIADDLSAYYLLGYYSTNPKLDGRFRTIAVRVKRPGVEIRARRGYRAPTEAEVAGARTAPFAPATTAPVNAVASAIAALVRVRQDARFRIHAIPVRSTDAGPVTTVWVAGELPPAQHGWGQGGTALLDITGGGASGSVEVTLKPGERAFLTSIPVQGAAVSIDVRGRLSSPDPSVTPFAETIRLDLAPGAPPQPLLFRRGPSTGNRIQPAADFQFSRAERARVELPLRADMKPASGRLLDRNGQALQVPVTIGERTDTATGQRWLTADVTLAALGSGEYVIEVSAAGAGAEQKTLTAIRVTR